MKKIKKPHSSDKYIWRIIKTREPVHGQLVIKNVLSKTANHARLRVFSDPYFPVLYRKIQFWENPCSGIFYAAKNWASYWHTILKAIHNTAYDMRKYVFSLTRILPYNDRIYDSVLIRKNTGQWKPVFSHILCSVSGNHFTLLILFDDNATFSARQNREKLDLFVSGLLVSLTWNLNKCF